MVFAALGWLFLQFTIRLNLYNSILSLTSIIEEVTETSPAVRMSRTLSKDGFTADAYIHSGKQEIHLNFKIIASQKRLNADGTISSEDNLQNFSLYLDPNVLTFSVDPKKERHYGINFHTFQKDLEQIPLINWILPDHFIKQWDTSLQKIPELFNKIDSFCFFPEINLANISSFAKFLWILPAEINISASPETTESALRIVFKFQSDTAPSYLKEKLKEKKIDPYNITATFYMNKKDLAIAEITLRKGNDLTQISVEYPNNTSEYLRSVLFSETETGREVVKLTLNTDGSEFWAISNDYSEIMIDWNPTTNIMLINNGTNSVSLVYQKEEDGFSIESDDLKNLMMFIDPSSERSILDDHCRIKIVKGAYVPESYQYKNLSEWTLEDLLTIWNEIENIFMQLKDEKAA